MMPQDGPLPERVELFALTVGAVWREARVSCPHRDILRAWREGSLTGPQADYLRFHIEEAECPYCQANLEDFAREEAASTGKELDAMRHRLVSSTITILREKRDRS